MRFFKGQIQKFSLKIWRGKRHSRQFLFTDVVISSWSVVFVHKALEALALISTVLYCPLFFKKEMIFRTGAELNLLCPQLLFVSFFTQFFPVNIFFFFFSISCSVDLVHPQYDGMESTRLVMLKITFQFCECQLFVSNQTHLNRFKFKSLNLKKETISSTKAQLNLLHIRLLFVCFLTLFFLSTSVFQYFMFCWFGTFSIWWYGIYQTVQWLLKITSQFCGRQLLVSNQLI